MYKKPWILTLEDGILLYVAQMVGCCTVPVAWVCYGSLLGKRCFICPVILCRVIHVKASITVAFF